MSILEDISKKSRNDELYNCCSFLLEYFHVKHSNLYLKNLLTDHIYYPSLLSIRDTLFEYGIESLAVNRDEHSYKEFELPFVCSIQQQDWPIAAFTVVTDLDYNHVHYLDPLSNKITIASIEKFKSINLGPIMLIDGSKATDEKNLSANVLNKHIQSFWYNMPFILTIIGIVNCVGYILIHSDGIYMWICLSYLTTAFLGVSISILLISHEFDKDNKLLKQVCGIGGRKANCNAVLSSPQSVLFGVSWSIWGGAYFFMVFLVQLLFATVFSFLVVTGILSLLVVPYVFYSIYLQWHVIKQWCLLCLLIQFLLVINALIAISMFLLPIDEFQYYTFNVFDYTITFLIGAFVFYLLFRFIPIFKLAQNNKETKKNLKLIKSDRNVFNYFLKSGEHLKKISDKLGIVIGDPSAQDEIIKVCHPYCSYCSDVHLKIEQLMNSHNVRVRIIFAVSTGKNDIGAKVVAHFLAIEQEYSSEILHKALNYWYSDPYKDYEIFATRFVITNNLADQNQKILSMERWVNAMNIRVTPTIFYNGYQFPAVYKIDDLIDILNDDS